MENSAKLIFGKDNAPQWYIAMGEKWIGPLAASDVYSQIQSGNLTWAHFAWKKGQAEWTRLCDLDAFKAAVPHEPTKEVLREVKANSQPASSPKVKAATGKRGATPPPAPSESASWFLYYSNSQFGPFTHEEVSRFLHVGKINANVHAWSEGMANWERLAKVQEFRDAVSTSKKVPAAKTSGGKAKEIELERMEQRQSPRKPLVARLLIASTSPSNESVIVGVCRDISVGGMQVLTDQLPGKPGARLKFNVSPPRDPASKAKAGKAEVDAFVAEGVIVRILEDGRGFSFRFERLADNAKRAIERYIGTGD